VDRSSFFASWSLTPTQFDMGQANHVKYAPCICGSGRKALDCCRRRGGWHKSASVVSLSNSQNEGEHKACYLRATKSCDGTITGEHYVSQSVLKVLADKAVEVSGAPWLKGETKRLPFSALVANCLCKAHNSALSDLDREVGLFFSAMQRCVTTPTGPGFRFIFSGHDIERAMLKMLAGMAVSGGLGVQGKALPGTFHPSISLESMFEDIHRWKEPLGLYLTHRLGTAFRADALFQVQPLVFRGTEHVSGLLTNVQGLRFGLLAIPTETKGTPLQGAIFRPGRLCFHLGGLTHIIMLSWEDDNRHPDIDIAWK
jgi:hypothetical protein